MKTFASATGVFWALSLGIISLFAFFTATGAIAPGEVGWLTAGVGCVAALSAIHFLHVRHALGDRHHGELARRVHAMRETRGF